MNRNVTTKPNGDLVTDGDGLVRSVLNNDRSFDILITWSDTLEPSTDCPYHHINAYTPFGRFLITWKGWKNDPTFFVDETPWGVAGVVYDSVKEAKKSLEEEYNRRIDLKYKFKNS